jgi:hypothetical protein
MHDDEMMDRLLRDTMAADAPQLSPGFDARVLRCVRPLRLTPVGRAVIGLYIVAAVSMAVWLMRDVPMPSIVAAAAIGIPIAIGARAYGRHIAVGR